MSDTILALETSTTVCSVALLVGNEVISFRESMEANSHAASLTVFIDEVMKESGMPYNHLNAIAVSEGPGSYTGLRIGVSVGKGLAYSLSIPLIAVSTLQTMALSLIHNYLSTIPLNASLVPMIDARRMEVYSAIYNAQGSEIRKVEAQIIDELSFSEELAKGAMLFFGNGSDKCKPVLIHPNAHFPSDIVPHAKDMVWIAQEKFQKNEYVDLAYFEPFYLKDFMVSLPKNKVL